MRTMLLLRHRPLLLRRRRRHHQASFSTTAAPAIKEKKHPSPPPPSQAFLPIRHSRNQLPIVCTDATELSELTQQVLEAPSGSLFSYKDANSRTKAWKIADETIQLVEFILRGHAYLLPGTQWNRWLKTTTTKREVDVTQTLETMEDLIDRLQGEGYTYMQLRAARLKELKQEADEEEERDYLNDFALPGPTVKMFDCLLDSMASQAGNSPKIEPDWAFLLLELMISRHILDGGNWNAADDTRHPGRSARNRYNTRQKSPLTVNNHTNSNPHTIPTILSYNAAIRVAAEMPYDHDNDELRDDAVLLAFSAFDALTHTSTHYHSNSATYTYLLQVVAKFFPPSITRGNVAKGLFRHALDQGLLDDTLLQAYLAANEPSNGPYIESQLAELRTKSVQDFSQKSRRYHKVRRYQQHEDTY